MCLNVLVPLVDGVGLLRDSAGGLSLRDIQGRQPGHGNMPRYLETPPLLEDEKTWVEGARQRSEKSTINFFSKSISILTLSLPMQPAILQLTLVNQTIQPISQPQSHMVILPRRIP